ncbi:putative recombinase [Neoasaia chiangmaiensis NBRC 101099]|uniref:recombinase family protein n=1 Tax=Neoasaia chiangmaiensis TaxID=320497 RepID=UPI00098AD39B|nr:recombinase family protein [Neoasaia chiangmaiensis]GBR36551.1 putative recombinase [Neoasaia chiangmaiensis NBRC 101099]GEN15304.1 resolvase [Neoasaia chiangmaiensis]
MKTNRHNLRIALYGRFSTSRQNAASSADQLHAGEKYATQHGWTVVARFTDDAISGAYEHGRAGLQELKQQAMLGQFDVVVVESVDRLGRNVSEVTALYRRLKFHGIEVHTYTSGKQTDLVIAIMSSVAEAQLEEIAHKTRRGAKANILKKRSAGGRAYGYVSDPKLTADGKLDKGHQKICPAEAKIVRRIFDEYAFGKSPIEIARKLNLEGIPGPRRPRKKGETQVPGCSQWQVSTILGHASRGTGIIHNELYRGWRVWNQRMYLKNPDTGKRVARQNPEEDIERIEDQDLRLVTEEQWNAIRKREAVIRANMKKRACGQEHNFRDARRPTSFLSGIIKCAACGGNVGLVLRDRWGCLGHHRGTNCTNNRTKKRDVVEQRILSGLAGPLVTGESIEIALQAYNEECQALYAQWLRQSDAGREKLASIDAQINNIMKAIEFAPDVSVLANRLTELSKERKALAEAIKPVPAPMPNLQRDFSALFHERVKNLGAVIGDPNHGREASDKLRSLIQSVEFRPGQARGEVGLTLVGDMAGILALAAGNDNLEVTTEAVVCPRNQKQVLDWTR